jgi:hypothetical protein
MPTPESDAAFRKFVSTRERLAEATKQITGLNTQQHTSIAANQRYEELQTEWDEAFREFQEAWGDSQS